MQHKNVTIHTMKISWKWVTYTSNAMAKFFLKLHNKSTQPHSSHNSLYAYNELGVWYIREINNQKKSNQILYPFLSTVLLKLIFPFDCFFFVIYFVSDYISNIIEHVMMVCGQPSHCLSIVNNAWPTAYVILFCGAKLSHIDLVVSKI